jgi:Xaa-Pro dipeptidase
MPEPYPFPERLERLAWELRQADLGAFCGSSPITMGYLHGFFEEGGERFLTLIVTREGRTGLICPALTETQARRCGIREVFPWKDGEDSLALLTKLAQDWGLEAGTMAVDSDMAAAQLLAMQAVLPRVSFKPGQPLMSCLMRTKTEAELELLLKAGRIADEAFPIASSRMRPGMTELEAAGLLLEAMRQLGGVPTFCIAAAGANSAEPHHHSDGTRLKEGDALILDFGCSVAGYQSDITRTVALGRASGELKEIYDIVLRAHLAGRAAIQAGVPCQEIDRAARKVITEAGYGPQFMHRTGHGIGLRGHEEPYIIDGNALPLVPGHCFSVEPGIYLPGRFGVRIENCVTCTADGHRSLNAEPHPGVLEI